MKILFICSANKDRSKTAEDFFAAKYPAIDFRSAGTNFKICQQLGTEPLTEELLEWADQILAMEARHRKHAQAMSKAKLKITVLGVPDVYKYYQRELIGILEERVEPILSLG